MSRPLKIILFSFGCLWGLLLAFGFSGAMINTTPSFPLGLYWTVDSVPEKGDMVAFCPPQNAVFSEAKGRGYITAGFCPGGYSFLMKKILAIEGDRVVISKQGVWVNEDYVANSAPMERDNLGRPMPSIKGSFTLTWAEVLLMSDYNRMSFDARYFGPVNRAHIKSVVRPIFTWDPEGIRKILPAARTRQK